ncbi:hypothetical protein E2320_010613 [Naja naja]|nr:hypothetical protein E2320_010613 [Naja naja]
MIWRCSAGAELFSLMALWEWIALSLHCWVLAVAAGSDQHATSPFDWLLSDKGPFHRSPEYTDFVDRSRQGFSTRYKIYRVKVKQSYIDIKPWLLCFTNTESAMNDAVPPNTLVAVNEEEEEYEKEEEEWEEEEWIDMKSFLACG